MSFQHGWYQSITSRPMFQHRQPNHWDRLHWEKNIWNVPHSELQSVNSTSTDQIYLQGSTYLMKNTRPSRVTPYFQGAGRGPLNNSSAAAMFTPHQLLWGHGIYLWLWLFRLPPSVKIFNLYSGERYKRINLIIASLHLKSLMVCVNYSSESYLSTLNH